MVISLTFTITNDELLKGGKVEVNPDSVLVEGAAGGTNLSF
jgi:hypothetical protein